MRGFTFFALFWCAWILWEQERTWTQRPPATDVWSIIEAFETKAECESERRTHEALFGIGSPPASVAVTYSTARRYLCYPDTVTPDRKR